MHVLNKGLGVVIALTSAACRTSEHRDLKLLGNFLFHRLFMAGIWLHQVTHQFIGSVNRRNNVRSRYRITNTIDHLIFDISETNSMH